MNKQSISFKADEQKLTKTGGIEHYASNIVAYIEATFDLGTNWNGYDSVRAVWSNDYLTDISTVLDSNGKCIVPTEVLTDTGNVTVNLVGSIADGDTLTDRLTTYPCKAVVVDADAKVEGDETESITPSEFEQFVEIVHDEVEQVTGMTAEAETLPAGSDATASYSDGVLSLGIPRGDKGEHGETGPEGPQGPQGIQGETGPQGETGATGNGIASTVLNPDYTLTITFTDGTSYTTPSIRGAKGDKGDTGDTGATGNGIQSTVLNADYTLTITFTDGTSYTTPSIRGEQGPVGPVSDVQVNGTSVVDQNGVAVITMPELVKTVQGNPIVLDDAFGEVKNLDVELLPIQAGTGTPSPQNIRPITGHDSVEVTDTGKNQWDEEWELGGISGSTGQNVPQTNVIRSTNYIPVVPSKSYYIRNNTVQGTWVYLWYYDRNKQFVSNSGGYLANGIFTIPENIYYVRFQCYASYGQTYKNDISINYPSTDTAYHAYHGQSKTVTLPHTVYGAGVGVTSGESKETWNKIVLDGTQPIGLVNWQPKANSVGWIYPYYLTNNKPASTAVVGNVISDELESKTYDALRGTDTVGIGVYLNASTYGLVVRMNDTTLTTEAAINAYLAQNPIEVCYELATPTDLSTTPTDITLYNGDNVISSDGDMELTYVQDMAIVIRKIESQL